MIFNRVSPISVAPMMERTDRHCRFFLRQISRHVRLYSEMVTTAAVLRGDHERLLGIDAAEHPVALQLGGSEPAALAACAHIAEAFGYDEVNLNVGCPSDRVQAGRFGACLMAEPALVARCFAAMQDAVSIPVTVKHRIGIDDQEDWPALRGFVAALTAAGCGHVIVHARKAWLRGLSPKENREVPPLRYELVYRLKDAFPDLGVTINGGVRSLDAGAAHLGHVDGVMLGRAAYEDPYLLAAADARFFAGAPAPGRHAVVNRMVPYIDGAVARGTPLRAISRHMIGLFNGQPGERSWRRALSENAGHPGAGSAVVRAAAALVRDPSPLQAAE